MGNFFKANNSIYLFFVIIEKKKKRKYKLINEVLLKIQMQMTNVSTVKAGPSRSDEKMIGK